VVEWTAPAAAAGAVRFRSGRYHTCGLQSEHDRLERATQQGSEHDENGDGGDGQQRDQNGVLHHGGPGLLTEKALNHIHFVSLLLKWIGHSTCRICGLSGLPVRPVSGISVVLRE